MSYNQEIIRRLCNAISSLDDYREIYFHTGDVRNGPNTGYIKKSRDYYTVSYTSFNGESNWYDVRTSIEAVTKMLSLLSVDYVIYVDESYMEDYEICFGQMSSRPAIKNKMEIWIKDLLDSDELL